MRKRLAVVVAVLALAGACGNGGGDDEAAKLRDEVAALRQQIATTSSTAAPATTTTEAPTTTTTKRQPQGTVSWSYEPVGANYLPCASFRYTFNNASDTPVLDLTVKGVYFEETFRAPDNTLTGSRKGAVLPPQTFHVGIPAYGEKTVDARWCGKVSPGTEFIAALHDKSSLSWNWAAQ